MSDYGTLIPVNVLTGALGAGKTTVLARLLRDPRLSDVAVLVNELGEIGIDHHLIEHARESTLVLENGCVCCVMRDDLKAALRDLHARRERGEIPSYERVVVETTGIADPVPIAYTLLAEPVLQHHYRLGNVITVVDAINAEQQLHTLGEHVKQIALADRLLLSKTDLADASRLAPLYARLGDLNPGAPIHETASNSLDARDVLVADVFDLEAKRRDTERWLAGTVHGGSPSQIHRHAENIHAHCFSFTEALDWTAFGVWMTMLLHRHGDRVLRIKGLLNVADLPGPVLVNGVQHLVHPPAHLDAWPDMERASHLVVIMRDLDRDAIEASLDAFNGLVNAATAQFPAKSREARAAAGASRGGTRG